MVFYLNIAGIRCEPLVPTFRCSCPHTLPAAEINFVSNGKGPPWEEAPTDIYIIIARAATRRCPIPCCQRHIGTRTPTSPPFRIVGISSSHHHQLPSRRSDRTPTTSRPCKPTQCRAGRRAKSLKALHRWRTGPFLPPHPLRSCPRLALPNPSLHRILQPCPAVLPQRPTPRQGLQRSTPQQIIYFPRHVSP